MAVPLTLGAVRLTGASEVTGPTDPEVADACPLALLAVTITRR